MQLRVMVTRVRAPSAYECWSGDLRCVRMVQGLAVVYFYKLSGSAQGVGLFVSALHPEWVRRPQL